MRDTLTLPPGLGDLVHAAAADWERGDKVRRLWARDPSLWTGRDEGEWLGWLDIVAAELAAAPELEAFAAEIKREGLTHVLLLGMGGSSLGPEVLAESFGPQPGFPRLLVLDSTDPAQVRAFEARTDPARTLYIVASKSGTTLEPTILQAYFHARAEKALGAAAAGRRFVAITDPGSKLEDEAHTLGFRRVFSGVPAIGGRYSVLSHFGMVPAAVAGIDVRRLLERAQAMVAACGPGVPPAANPGVMLGLVLGVLATRGRDKVTFVASPATSALGAWLEQLLAESTGKEGKALIPVDREPLGAPAVYGDDRVLVYLRPDATADTGHDAAVAALEHAGQPVVRIGFAAAADLGREFFRWEIATAVAGSVLGINPFDQPDVEASKVAARALTAEFEKSGAFPAEEPLYAGEGVMLFADGCNAAEIERGAGGERTLSGLLRAHLARVRRDDYVALLAFLEMSPAHEAELAQMRTLLREAKHVATCLGFGPRFLHSTGQAYKGGPATGVFLQITANDAADLAVPGRATTFGVVKAAQARGDLTVLAERGRRVLRIHLQSDVRAGLAVLRAALARAL